MTREENEIPHELNRINLSHDNVVGNGGRSVSRTGFNKSHVILFLQIFLAGYSNTRQMQEG